MRECAFITIAISQSSRLVVHSSNSVLGVTYIHGNLDFSRFIYARFILRASVVIDSSPFSNRRNESIGNDGRGTSWINIGMDDLRLDVRRADTLPWIIIDCAQGFRFISVFARCFAFGFS
jgi:hypothetical protein